MTEREERMWASIAHLAVLLGIVFPLGNVIVPAVFYFAKRNESRFVRFHALQSLHLQMLDTALAAVLVGFGLATGLLYGDPILQRSWTFGWPILAPFGYAVYAVSAFTFIYPLTIAAGARSGEWKGYPVLERWLPPAPGPDDHGEAPLATPGRGARVLVWIYIALTVLAITGWAISIRAYRAGARGRSGGTKVEPALTRSELEKLGSGEIVEYIGGAGKWHPTAAQEELIRRGPKADAAIAGALVSWPAADTRALTRVLELRERLGPEFLPGLRRCVDSRKMDQQPVHMYCRIDPLPASELPFLIALLADMSVQGHAVDALRRLPAETTPAIVALVHDPGASPVVRAGAAEGLGSPAHASEEAVSALRKALSQDRVLGLPVAAIRGLCGMGPGARAAVPDLAALLPQGSLDVHEALERIGPEGWVPLREFGDTRRREAEEIRRRSPGHPAWETDRGPIAPAPQTLAEHTYRLGDGDIGIRLSAALALGRLGPEAGPSAPALLALVDRETDPTICMAACEALGEIGPAAIGADLPRARQSLRAAAQRVSNESRRRAIREALAKLEGQGS